MGRHLTHLESIVQLNAFGVSKLDILLLKSSNKKFMLLRDDDRIDKVSDCESDDNNNTPPLEDVEENVEYPTEGEALVIRRVLNVQVKLEENNQNENIFYTYCLVNGKVYSLIIDGGSGTNVTNTTVVDKLVLDF